MLCMLVAAIDKTETEGKRMKKHVGLCVLILSLLAGCSDMSTVDKQSTISAAAGGAVGAGVAAFTGSPYMAAAILIPVGATVGYYVPKVASQTQAIEAAGGVVLRIGDYLTIVLPVDQVFDTGTAHFLQTTDALIAESADIIHDAPDSLVLVTAHSDNIGSSLSSAKLTRTQAMRVALALWESRRIDTKTFGRFQFVGMGDTQPIADNTTSKGQALNRRIEITIYPKTMAASVDKAMAGQVIEAIS